MTQEVLAVTGEPKGTVELPDAVFAQKVRKDIIWEAVNVYLANQRQGTAKTKTRAEVSGGGKKPWRQKHTGRARHGSTRSPIWRHGGVVFGPIPRDYSMKLPAGKRAMALQMSLSSLRQENRLRVVEDFDVPSGKTRDLAKVLSDLGLGENSTLLVLEKASPTMNRAARNMPLLDLMRVQDLNAYSVLGHETLVFMESAIGGLRTEGTTSERR
jgi:large subunit ribosomal protein L4